MKTWKKIDKWLAKLAVWVIKGYQYTLSPDKGLPSLWLKGRVCMHEPHCSQYGIEVYRRYGFFKGLWRSMDRVAQCTGGTHKVYDPAHYRVVFFSSAPIGVPFLEQLFADDRFEVVGVVTQCDKPAGRGMSVCENVIKTESKKHKVGSCIDNVLLLDGFDGDGTSNWFPWLKTFLEVQGIKVYNPCPKSADKPVLQEQLDDIIQNYGDVINEKTIIVGHSLGCLLANHIITKLGKKIAKLISVAPAFRDNDIDELVRKFPGFADAQSYLKNYQKEEFDCKELEKLVGEHIVYISDNDPFIPFKEVKTYYKNNFDKAIIKTFHEKGHFNDNAGVNTLPEVSSDILFVVTPNKLNPEKSDEGKEFAQRLEDKEPDLLVVIAYGKIIPQAILDIPKIAPINVHGSLLPNYRGASPLQTIFLNGDKETGITIMKMDAGMDTGNIIDILKFDIPFDRTVKNVITKLQDIGPKYMCDVLWKYGKKMLGEVKQDDSKATLCAKIEKEDGLIDPRKDSLESIYRKYRAYYLWPKIYFNFEINKPTLSPSLHKEGDMTQSIRVIIEELRLHESVYEEQKNSSLIIDEKNLNVDVEHLMVKPEGKKAMGWNEFTNGYIK